MLIYNVTVTYIYNVQMTDHGLDFSHAYGLIILKSAKEWSIYCYDLLLTTTFNSFPMDFSLSCVLLNIWYMLDYLCYLNSGTIKESGIQFFDCPKYTIERNVTIKTLSPTHLNMHLLLHRDRNLSIASNNEIIHTILTYNQITERFV